MDIRLCRDLLVPYVHQEIPAVLDPPLPGCLCSLSSPAGALCAPGDACRALCPCRSLQSPMFIKRFLLSPTMVENLQDMLDLPGLVVVLTILAREFLAGTEERG